MKNTITLLITVLITTLSFAQQGINYKALIKDDLGNVLNATFMNVQFTIHQATETGTIVYQEDHNYTTDANGLIILNIGTDPSPSIGTFATIDWSADLHFLQTSITYSGGTIDFDATQFMAVPYAYRSLDNLWQLNDDNAISIAEKVGIGTSVPTQLLSIEDQNNASIKLAASTTTDTTSIRFENGPNTGFYSHYKIENTTDILSFELDSDLTLAEGYEQRMSLSNSGLELENGARINEFSTDGTLAGNSFNVVPTEAAVKTYVDNAIPSNTSKTIIIPATLFTGNQNINNVVYGNFGAYANYWSGSAYLMAPLSIPVGSSITSITFFLRDTTTAGGINLEVALLRGFQSGTTVSQIFSLSTSATATELTYNTPISIADNYQYILRVQPTTIWDGLNLTIHSVRITYTE